MAVEGKFGQGKRRFGLGRLMAKLALTSEVMIQVSFLVMNLEHLLTRVGSFVFVAWWPSCRSAWKGLLLARWLKLKTNFRDRRACGIEARGVSGPQLLV
jgi:hypothetical protein